MSTGIGWMTDDDLDVLEWYFRDGEFGGWAPESKRPVRQYAHRNEIFVRDGLMEIMPARSDRHHTEPVYRLTKLGKALAREIINTRRALIDRLVTMYTGDVPLPEPPPPLPRLTLKMPSVKVAEAMADPKSGLIMETPENFLDLITCSEAARITGEAESSWRNRCAAGKVPGAFKKGKTWLMPRSAITDTN